MDYQWAEAQLVRYLDLCAQVRQARPGDGYWNQEAQRIDEQAQLMLTTVEKIMRALDATQTVPLQPPSYASLDGEGRVRRCLGALRYSAEVEAHLQPDAPELPADEMHPVIWRPAALLWDTGQFRVAVAQAALALSARVKTRARSRLSDRKLMQEVFAPEQPRPGATRLHLPGDHEDETWKSQQQGLHLLAQGAYAGIRNIAVHDDLELIEQEALEYLAVLSVIARWFDQTDLVEGP